jgi:hypothetical protein
MLSLNKEYCFVLSMLIILGCSKPKSESENPAVRVDSAITTTDTLSKRVKSDYTLIRIDSIVAVSNNITREIDTMFVNENESGIDSTQEEGSLSSEYFFNSTHDVISLVGPYLSYEYSYDGSGGAHPIYGSYYRTVYIPTKKEVSLDSLFAPDVVFQALLNDSLIVHSLTNKNPKDLYELTSSLEGECEISFSDLLISFAIKSIDPKKVEVEFGLTHGCEVMRGNFTTITIILPISSVLSQYCNY